MKVGLAGTGWRAQMYVRVMKALGEEFEVSAVYVHSESSREREEKNFPGKVYTDYDEFLATKPDCVVFMLKYGAALPFAEKAMEHHFDRRCQRIAGVHKVVCVCDLHICIFTVQACRGDSKLKAL